MSLESSHAELDLVLHVYQRREGFGVVFEYRSGLFASSTIDRFAELFRIALQTGLERPHIALGELLDVVATRDRAITGCGSFGAARGAACAAAAGGATKHSFVIAANSVDRKSVEAIGRGEEDIVMSKSGFLRWTAIRSRDARRVGRNRRCRDHSIVLAGRGWLACSSRPLRERRDRIRRSSYSEDSRREPKRRL